MYTSVRKILALSEKMRRNLLPSRTATLDYVKIFCNHKIKISECKNEAQNTCIPSSSWLLDQNFLEDYTLISLLTTLIQSGETISARKKRSAFLLREHKFGIWAQAELEIEFNFSHKRKKVVCLENEYDKQDIYICIKIALGEKILWYPDEN